MDLTLTEDQELIQRTAREFLTSRSPSPKLWQEITELGWPGLAFEESLGFLESCLLIEELGRAGVPSPFVSTVACCGMAFARCGAGDWLEEVAAGRVFAYVPGPVSLSDGVADLVPYAGEADYLVVATGDSVVVLDAATPGISCQRQDVIGPDPRYRVEFASVTVPPERELAVDPTSIEAFGAAATCAEMVGGAQGVLDATVAYAKQREQFGRPIGGFQAVQHHCANMAIDVLGSRFIAYEAIWRLGRGLPAEVEVSLAKSWVSEAYERVCALGHQVHGAIGFTAEHDLHHYTRHAIASALTFGDADTHTDRLASHLGL
jgi:3-oxocholest-4-en-26-oyl-CoA dehydrogenase beta subunit